MSGRRAIVVAALILVIAAMMPFAMVISTGDVSARTTHDPINIMGDDDFTEENGVSAGNGTPEDPYVIEGWEMDPGYIEIWNTNASFVIRDVAITTNYGVSAISLLNASHFSISDCTLEGGGNGLFATDAHDFLIEDNTITCGAASMLGSNTMLWISDSGDFEVTGNILTNEGMFGAQRCSEFTISENDVSASRLTLAGCTNASMTTNELAKGIDLQGPSLEHFDSHEMSGNTAGSYQILYFIDEELRTVSNVQLGQLIVVNCSEVVVQRLYINIASGVCVYFSDAVSITNCTILQPTTGVVVQYCDDVNVDRCLIRDAEVGVRADEVETLSIRHSIIEGCGLCVRLNTEDAVISYNMIRDSYGVIGIEMIGTAEIFCNNIVNVTVPMIGYNPSLTFDEVFWNSEYPTGGNYWDVYNGTDEYGGPDQNETGADGFGDTPYETELVIDPYPLMRPLTIDFGPASEDEEEVVESSEMLTLGMALVAMAAIICAAVIVIYVTGRRGRSG